MIDKKSGVITDILKNGTELAKALLDVGVGAYATAAAGTIGLGGLAGWGIARATSPSSVVENTDKELEREALETEIDVTQRRIAALMQRKEKLAQRKQQERPYDRFV